MISSKFFPLSVFLFSLVIITSCGKQIDFSHYFMEELEERKKISELGIKSQVKIVNDKKNHVIDYDKDGRVLEERWYNPKGVVVVKKVNHYNDNILVRTDWFRVDDHMKSFNEYTYDEARNIIRESRFRPSGAVIEIIDFLYNEEEFLSEKIFYRNENHILRRNLFSYNDHGKRTEFVELDSEGRITNRQEYFYDSRKNLINEMRYKDGNQLSTIKSFEYDSFDSLIIEKEYDSKNTLLKKAEYTYNEKRLPVEVVWTHYDIDAETNIIYNYIKF